MLEPTLTEADDEIALLLRACERTSKLALSLAARAQRESLRALLQARVRRYSEIAQCLLGFGARSLDATDEVAVWEAGVSVAAQWEHAESDVLIRLRDALDADPPPAVQEALRDWIDQGLSALECLHRLGDARAEAQGQARWQSAETGAGAP